MATLFERAAKKKADAQALVKEYGDDMTEAQFAEVKALVDEAEALTVEAKAKSERMAAIKSIKEMDFGGGEDAGTPAAVEAKSLGDHFVKHAGDVLSKQSAGAHLDFSAPEFESKAASDPAKTTDFSQPFRDGWGTFYNRTIVNQRRTRLVAADLMGSATVTQPTIKYLVEKAKRLVDGAPKMIAEGAQKPYVKFADFDIVTESLGKLAALTKLTDEMLEDYGFVADWINQQLLHELSVIEEAQLLNGDGQGNNLKGLLQREGIQEHELESAEDFDGIYKARNLIPRATNLTADAFLISPADADALRLAKDKNGQYLAGGPFQNQYGNGGLQDFGSVWGLRIVEAETLPEGTAIIGAFRQGATVLRKGGLRVDSTNTNQDDFEKNLVTLRAEQRMGLMVPLPAAFVKISFKSGDTA